MAHLSLTMLGPFYATLDGVPITDFESNKVRALLVYLAIESKRRHSRETLGLLLWPDRSSPVALKNLRTALSNLRQAIGDDNAAPPYLKISRDTLQFNRRSNYWLDVNAFEHHIARSKSMNPAQAPEHPTEAVIRHLAYATRLYQGSFLEGLSVKDSLPFEEWVLFKQEQFHRRALSALYHLAQAYERQCAYGKVETCARRQLELEPWREEAARQLMRALALDGQRSAALAQYERCRRLLAKELHVDPAVETKMLYEQIRDGDLESARACRMPSEVWRAVAPAQPAFPNVLNREKSSTPSLIPHANTLTRPDICLDMADQARMGGMCTHQRWFEETSLP